MIPEEFILEVKQKTNIYTIVAVYVDLKKVGKNWQGLCPFHKEKTPSFHVNEEKQVYKCFGCGKGGGVIDFIKEQERKTFPQAIYSLALRAGLINEKTSPFFNIDSSLAESVTKGTVYVLLLEGNKYYIGFTNDVERRVKQHFDGEGAVWTKKNKPIRLLETFENASLEFEDEMTEGYMRKFGWKNVRGGNFVFTEMDYKETPENIHQRKRDGAYLLQLAGDKYYVGFSTNIEDDITKQFNGRGCEWTKLYRPIKVLKVVKSLNRQAQMNMTLIAMKDLGWENVRGYRWLDPFIDKPPELDID